MLTIIYKNKQLVTNSREIAAMVGKNHYQILRAIRECMEILYKFKFEVDNFFIKDTYLDLQGKPRPCYLLTKNGCAIVANKITKSKRILFNDEYITKFDEMEKILNPCIEDVLIKSLFEIKNIRLRKEKIILLHKLE